MILRRALTAAGIRYRLDAADLPGRPDLVFRTRHVAVFVDGDFWHGRDLDARVARLAAGHNAPYWVAKIRTNAARDARNNEILAGLGWFVLRVWESDLLADDAARAVQSIAVALGLEGLRRGRRA